MQERKGPQQGQKGAHGSPSRPAPAEGSHSWATGTACWTLLNVWLHILGVRAEVDGLRIDPCMPSHRTRAEMTRNFRSATYEIGFQKLKGICKGHVTVQLDGQALPRNLIPPQGDGKIYRVTVVVSWPDGKRGPSSLRNWTQPSR